MAENLSSVVFDLGTCYSKIGEASEEAPRAVLPSMYCCTNEDFIMCAANTGKLEHYFGYDAFRREGILKQHSFFDSDRDVHDAEVVGKFLHQSMYDNFDNSETGHQGVILLDKPFTSTKTKKRLAETMLEWNKFQRCLAVPDYVGALYSTGKSTGIVLSCGYSMTYGAAVFDGIPSPLTIEETTVNSQRIEAEYREILRDIAYTKSQKGEKTLGKTTLIQTRRFFEDNAIVSSPNNPNDKNKVKLPDGSEFELPQREFTDPFEQYFSENQKGLQSLQNIVVKSAKMVSPFSREQLFSNVVLEGGVTKVPQFYERLYSEFQKQGTQKTKLAVTGDRFLLPWIGAAKLKDWLDEHKMWIDLRALNEKGIERTMAEISNAF